MKRYELREKLIENYSFQRVRFPLKTANEAVKCLSTLERVKRQMKQISRDTEAVYTVEAQYNAPYTEIYLFASYDRGKFLEFEIRDDSSEFDIEKTGYLDPFPAKVIAAIDAAFAFALKSVLKQRASERYSVLYLEPKDGYERTKANLEQLLYIQELIKGLPDSAKVEVDKEVDKDAVNVYPEISISGKIKDVDLFNIEINDYNRTVEGISAEAIVASAIRACKGRLYYWEQEVE